jgi:hypothetical protein
MERHLTVTVPFAFARSSLIRYDALDLVPGEGGDHDLDVGRVGRP